MSQLLRSSLHTFCTWVSLGVLALLSQGGLAATTWDLRQDWSESNNPNGVWSYNSDNVALPHIAGSTLPGGVLVNQPGWAACNSCRGFWFRANTSYAGADFLLGDIVVHTQDQYANPYFNAANVTWTSPTAGVVDISGGVWMDDFFPGRGNQWNLYVKGALVSSGSLSGSDIYNRDNPFSLSSGTGGAVPIENVSVSPGDVVKLELVRTTFDGFFVGTTLTVTAVPEPSTVLLASMGLVILLAAKRTAHTSRFFRA